MRVIRRAASLLIGRAFNVSRRRDLEACWAGRWTRPAPITFGHMSDVPRWLNFLFRSSRLGEAGRLQAGVKPARHSLGQRPAQPRSLSAHSRPRNHARAVLETRGLATLRLHQLAAATVLLRSPSSQLICCCVATFLLIFFLNYRGYASIITAVPTLHALIPLEFFFSNYLNYWLKDII